MQTPRAIDHKSASLLRLAQLDKLAFTNPPLFDNQRQALKANRDAVEGFAVAGLAAATARLEWAAEQIAVSKVFMKTHICFLSSADGGRRTPPKGGVLSAAGSPDKVEDLSACCPPPSSSPMHPPANTMKLFLLRRASRLMVSTSA